MILGSGQVRANFTLEAFASRQPEILIKDFVTYVRPLMEYCSPVWLSHLIRFIKNIEGVQRRFTTKLTGFSKLTYSDRLKRSRLSPLEYRRILFDSQVCHTIIRGLVDTSPDIIILILKDPNSTTRGHPLHIQK